MADIKIQEAGRLHSGTRGIGMGNYLQLGHESWNLLDHPDVGTFAGVVLSPVNDGPTDICARLGKVLETRSDLDIILDSQLYNPATQRGRLPEWEYYSADFETADRSDIRWWRRRIPEVVLEARRVNATTICSPAPIEARGTNDYFRFVVELGDEAAAAAADARLDCALTAVVPMDSLQDAKRALEVASILSSSGCDRIYLNFLPPDRVQQREPFLDQAALATAVHLVRLLSAEHRVHVACTSHDAVLWLGAGAHDVSTGKYMNVRRFSPGRWVDEQGRGRINAYWCDDKLLTLIRDQEVLRLDREGWFDGYDFSDNPTSEAILENLRGQTGEAWLRLSWIQYMRWFANTVERVTSAAAAQADLQASILAWREVQRLRILFIDAFNDGEHAVAWANAFDDGMNR